MRVFISQPMRDKTDEEIKRERKSVIELLHMDYEDVEIIDSFFETAPHGSAPVWYLGKSIQLLADADMAYFCYGWEKYRGCKIEHDICLAYGIEARHYQ